MAAVTMASFALSGEWLTKRAREEVLDGAWQEGLRLLTEEYLEGMDWNQAMSVLNGTARLVGSSRDPEGIGLEEHLDAAYRADVEDVYGPRYLDKAGKSWEPYAVVTSFGDADFVAHPPPAGNDYIEWRYAHPKDGPRPNRVDQIWSLGARALRYADNPQGDRVHRLKLLDKTRRETALVTRRPLTEEIVVQPLTRWTGNWAEDDAIVLFREVAPPPPWLPVKRQPQQALDAFAFGGHGGLDERGYIETHGLPRTPSLDDRVGKIRRLRNERPDTPEPDSVAGRILDGIQTGFTEAQREQLRRETEAHEKAKALIESFDRDLPAVRERINALAADNGGFIEVELPPEVAAKHPLLGGDTTLRIPRAPFEQWALWRTDGAHLALPWRPISPVGVKMKDDDPFHTDWEVGAGVDFAAFEADRHYKDSDIHSLGRIIDDLKARVQAEKMGFECAVLCGTGRVSGRVVHPKKDEKVPTGTIAVIPNAGPDYVEAALTAAAIITETGGAMAHLVGVGREQNLRIIRVPGARKTFWAGSTVEVNLSEGKVSMDKGMHRTMDQFTPPWDMPGREPLWERENKTADAAPEAAPAPRTPRA